MSNGFSLEELARSVQAWCDKHQVTPANGQAAEEITERNIRYYRTLGLLDPPLGHYAKTFSEKHRLQLIAIRLYQARGLPLRKIRDELYGKSEKDLADLEKQGRERDPSAGLMASPLEPPMANESWLVVPLAENFLLVSRQNKPLPRAVIERINEALRSTYAETEKERENN